MVLSMTQNTFGVGCRMYTHNEVIWLGLALFTRWRQLTRQSPMYRNEVPRGHPFMTSTRKSCFVYPSLATCVHMRSTPTPSPLWTSTCCRQEIHITLLKQ